MKLIDYLEEVKNETYFTLPIVQVRVMKDSYLYLMPPEQTNAKKLEIYRVTKFNDSFGLLKKLDGEIINNLKLDIKPTKYHPSSPETKTHRIISDKAKIIFKDTNINKNNPEKLV